MKSTLTCCESEAPIDCCKSGVAFRRPESRNDATNESCAVGALVDYKKDVPKGSKHPLTHACQYSLNIAHAGAAQTHLHLLVSRGVDDCCKRRQHTRRQNVLRARYVRVRG